MNKKGNTAIVAIIIVLVIAGIGYYAWSQGLVPLGQMQTETAPESTGSSETVDKNTIEIKGFGYSASTLTIKKGESVTWVNKDITGHSATADNGSFDTGIIGSGQSSTITFDEPGTFSYHCMPHPFMKATIVVE